jgi:hypothetical protein
MTLRTHPKMRWQGQPAWTPSSWAWTTTIEPRRDGSAEGIEQYGKLRSVRQFSENNGGEAIEILVDFEKAVYSAVIRLDDPAAVADLFTVLGGSQGYLLSEIGEVELSGSSRITAKQAQSC